MHAKAFKNEQSSPDPGFDLFRLSRSKHVVDVCSNTLRAYHRDGLQFYRAGKAVFVSKSELASYIRQRAMNAARPNTGGKKV